MHRVRHEGDHSDSSGYRVAVIAQRASGSNRGEETLNDVHVYRYPAPPEGSGMGAYILEYSYSLLAAFVAVTVGPY